MVTQKEIIEALREFAVMPHNRINDLANRIESEGIAPKPYVPMTHDELGDFWDKDRSRSIAGALYELQLEIIKRAGLEVTHD